MNLLVQLFQNHPYSASVISTWLFNNIVTVLITSMPAPTKESGQGYVYAFKVLNGIMGNLKRAQSTAIENSPNWQDAVTKHINGQAGTNQWSPTGSKQ